MVGHETAYKRALSLDYIFMAAYALAVFNGTWLGRSLSFTAMARRISTLAIGATAVAVLCDVMENEILRPVVTNPVETQTGLTSAAQAFAATKWVLILPAALIAAVALMMTLRRAFASRRGNPRSHGEDDPGELAPLVQRPAVDVDAQLARNDGPSVSHSAWRANSRLPDSRDCADGMVGICVSGGGIRSATFTLGALDVLRPVVQKARYLVSVSGGGDRGQPASDDTIDNHATTTAIFPPARQDGG